ncbi:MAG: hypothetical protein EBZ48_11430, partial [Proteobacteria bacterium]|nr:hypothetical protein [Pseudomonadota bacterium]
MWHNSTRAWIVVAVVAICTPLTPYRAYAEDEGVRLDELRAQLAAHPEQKKPEEIDAFAVVEGDVEIENQRLAAKEKEILAKLDPKADSGSASSGFVIQGRELGVKADEEKSVAKSKLVEDTKVPEQVQRVDTEAIARTEKELASLKSNNSQLTKKLSQTQGKLADSEREVKEAKDRLMMAEAEIQRLSQILERRGMESLAKGRAAAPVVSSAPVARPVAAVVAPKAADDLPIATVVVDKANLRTGPGTDNSSLMSVSRGTRL